VTMVGTSAKVPQTGRSLGTMVRLPLRSLWERPLGDLVVVQVPMGRSPKHPKSDDKYWEIGYHTLVKSGFPRSGLLGGTPKDP